MPLQNAALCFPHQSFEFFDLRTWPRLVVAPSRREKVSWYRDEIFVEFNNNSITFLCKIEPIFGYSPPNKKRNKTSEYQFWVLFNLGSKI